MERSELRIPLFIGLGGGGLALVAVALAAAVGEPYLSAERINGWIVVFAAGLFTAMFAGPFVLERLWRARIDDRDKRWERTLLAWGGVSGIVLVVGLLLGSPNGFAGDSLAGSIGLIVSIESALVVATLFVWLMSG